jgi:hypothetical protein
MINSMTFTPSTEPIRIDNREFTRWKKHYTFDALKGMKYGQSFCEYFDVTDYILYYTREPNRCDKYIRKTYIR